MNLLFSQKLLDYSATEAFNVMIRRVKANIASGKTVNSRSLLDSMVTIGDVMGRQGKRHVVNYKGSDLAYTLAQNKEYDLSLILYGVLIKNNVDNPALLEEFARKALVTSRKTNDIIHTMARIDDLTRLYRRTEYGSEKHIASLCAERDALVEIISDYENAVKSYKTVTRKAKSIDHYEFMLCGIRMEIAKLLKETHPLEAMQELEKAQVLMKKYGGGTLTSRISEMLEGISSKC